MSKLYKNNLDNIISILIEGAEIVLPDNSILEKIELSKKENRPLVIKLGFDPTAPDLHLGHAIVLRKLREFQELGHKIVLIIGDFTASIGDPTGKNKTRPPLSKEKIDENSKTYVQQLSKILDVSKVEIKYNSEWLSRMNLSDVIKLLATYNLGRMLTRDDFRKRYENEIPIAMHELVYPLLQGYDSLAIKADIEIGGTDQLFNLQVGRFLQEANGLPSQAIMCMPLLRGTDGTDKMSKSLGNYIGITEDPKKMFGKVMSIPDALLPEYIDLISSFDQQKKDLLKDESVDNPMETKKTLAFNIVEQFHSTKEAQDATEYFYRQFQDKSQNNIEYITVPLSSLNINKEADLVSVLVALKIHPSKSASRTLIQQGGVLVNGEKVKDPKYVLPTTAEEVSLRCGKMDFYKIILNK